MLFALYLRFQCLKDTQMHHIRLLFVLAALSVVLFFPLWLFHDGVTIWNDSGLVCEELI